jgi:hypothetical protein
MPLLMMTVLLLPTMLTELSPPMAFRELLTKRGTSRRSRHQRGRPGSQKRFQEVAYQQSSTIPNPTLTRVPPLDQENPTPADQ